MHDTKTLKTYDIRTKCKSDITGMITDGGIILDAYSIDDAIDRAIRKYYTKHFRIKSVKELV